MGFCLHGPFFERFKSPTLKTWYQWYQVPGHLQRRQPNIQHTSPNFQFIPGLYSPVAICPKEPKLKAGADGSPHLATFQGHQFLGPSRIHIGHLFQETKEQMAIGPGSWGSLATNPAVFPSWIAIMPKIWVKILVSKSPVIINQPGYFWTQLTWRKPISAPTWAAHLNGSAN